MRIRFRDFSRGWWATAPASEIPSGTLREAIGVRTFYGKAIKSRYGNSSIVTAGTDVQSLVVWRGRVMYSRSTAKSLLSLDPTSATITAVQNNIGGFPLRFAAGIPTPEVDTKQHQSLNNDIGYLFVVGGGLRPDGSDAALNYLLFKLDANHSTSPMGLLPPADDFVLGLQDPIAFPIETFGFIPSTWTTTGMSVAASNNAQVQNSSAKFTLGSDVNGTVIIPKTMNLGTYPTNFNGVSGTGNSVKQDWIRLWVHVDIPAHLDHLELQFDCTDGSAPTETTEGWTKVFSYSIFVNDSVDLSKPLGITDTEGASGLRDGVPHFDGGGSKFPTKKFKDDGSDDGFSKVRSALETTDVEATRAVTEMATRRVSSSTNTWTHLRIPKMLFTGSDEDMEKNHVTYWAKVRRVRINISSNDQGSVQVTCNQLDLHLGIGRQGDYKVALTTRSSKTGERSAPTKVKEVKGNLRQALRISQVRLPGENGFLADQVEVWSSLGGGNVLFLSRQVSLTNPVFNGLIYDWTADYEGMQEKITLAGLGEQKYVQAVVLPEDNVRLSKLTHDIAGPHLGRMFSLAKKEEGRVFYSPPGRLTVAAGFIDVTSLDEPLERLIFWNTIYAFSTKRIYELQNVQEPFLFREIFGCPGTSYPDTVIATPFGIIYYENDGVRLFNGSTSALFAIEAVNAFFQGEATGSVSILNASYLQTNFKRTPVMYAMYHEEEYYLSDGEKTLVVHLRTGVWRTLGVGLGPGHTEATTGQLIAVVNPKTVGVISYMEISTNVTDSGTAIPFEIVTPGTVAEDQCGATKIIQRVYFDANTNSQALTATLLTTAAGGTVALGSLTTAGRQLKEFSVCVGGDVVGVKLTGNLVQPVEIYEVGFDGHFPEEAGALT